MATAIPLIAMGARSNMGEDKYSQGRSFMVNSYSAAQSLFPINPMLIPFQVAIFIIVIIILGASPPYKWLIAYVIQAGIIFMISRKITDLVLSIFAI